MTIKTFGSPPSNDVGESFKIAGVDRTWHVRAKVPFLPLIKGARNADGAVAVEDVVRAAVVPAEVDDLLAVLTDPAKNDLTTEEAMELGRWLIQVGTARPTGRPVSSEAGPTTSGQSSRVTSSSPGTARTRSRSSARKPR